MFIRLRPVFVSIALVAAVMACAPEDEDDDDDGEPDYVCDTSINTEFLTSPSPGVVSASGSFYADEDVFARFDVNGSPVSVKGTRSGDKLLFVGIPRGGSIHLNFFVSCEEYEDGQEAHGGGGVIVN